VARERSVRYWIDETNLGANPLMFFRAIPRAAVAVWSRDNFESDPNWQLESDPN